MAGIRTIRYSTTHSAELRDPPMPDIDRDPEFMELFEATKAYTMTAKEVMYSTYQSVRYLAARGIPGDLVECGVWRGGNALLAALTLRRFAPPDAPARRIWLYDTFEGMTAPTEVDVDRKGRSAAEYIRNHGDEGKWCYADEADVREVFARHGFAEPELRFVRGDVAETLMRDKPARIAFLRLDTDWYESTLAELEQLYPRLSAGGILVIDDYGQWEGSRQATDEFFARNPPLYLARVRHSVRVAVKV